jgi:murein DD-endopeptidase MepM/ murein hydrolase activator NlpD
MRGNGVVLAVIAACTVSACIPRGAGDYRIGNSNDDAETAVPDPTAAPRQTGADPVSILPAETPSWSPATVERNSRLVDASLYTVRSGDTLYRIGNETGAGADAIARANGLSTPFALRVGQKIDIPAGLYHRVAAGETGIAIARAYAVSWADVVSLNMLEAPYTLRSGQYLRLPDVASAVPVDGGPAVVPTGRFTLNIDDIVTGSQPAAAEPGSTAPVFANPVATPVRFAGNFGWPVAGAILARFGSQGGGRVNDGVDIGAAVNTAVKAASDGVVVYAGNEIGVYGGLVLIDHGGGWISAYGHMGRIDVARGARVVRGQLIGGVGETGYVDTPQLHFELRRDRKPIDPLTQLPPR